MTVLWGETIIEYLHIKKNKKGQYQDEVKHDHLFPVGTGRVPLQVVFFSFNLPDLPRPLTVLQSTPHLFPYSLPTSSIFFFTVYPRHLFLTVLQSTHVIYFR